MIKTGSKPKTLKITVNPTAIIRSAKRFSRWMFKRRLKKVKEYKR